MPGNDKQAPQRRLTGPRKEELSAVDAEMGDSNQVMPEDGGYEDDFDDVPTADTARPSSSAIRLNNPMNLTGARRVINTTTSQGPDAMNRASTPIPPRRNGQAGATNRGPTVPSSTAARPTRSITGPQFSEESERQSRNIHWLLYVGVGMVAALTLFVVGSALLAWGSAKYNDIAYGNPRTFQMDAVVGHGGDSAAHPSHFIALNLNGVVIIIELRAGNPANSINYTGPHFYETGGNLIPVTLEFRDVNHDGKPDMLIHFQNNVILFLNDGTQFIPPKS